MFPSCNVKKPVNLICYQIIWMVSIDGTLVTNGLRWHGIELLIPIESYFLHFLWNLNFAQLFLNDMAIDVITWLAFSSQALWLEIVMGAIISCVMNLFNWTRSIDHLSFRLLKKEGIFFSKLFLIQTSVVPSCIFKTSQRTPKLWRSLFLRILKFVFVK